MSKAVKDLMIKSIQNRLGSHKEVVVIDVSKVDAVVTNKFRSQLRQKGIHCLGVKNAVARKSLTELGLSGISGALKGPSTLVFGGADIVELTKEVTQLVAATNGAVVNGGAIGETNLSANDVEVLSKSPGRAELLSMISGQILAPGANLAAALKGIGGKLASQVEKIAKG